MSHAPGAPHNTVSESMTSLEDAPVADLRDFSVGDLAVLLHALARGKKYMATQDPDKRPVPADPGETDGAARRSRAVLGIMHGLMVWGSPPLLGDAVRTDKDALDLIGRGAWVDYFQHSKVGILLSAAAAVDGSAYDRNWGPGAFLYIVGTVRKLLGKPLPSAPSGA